jgi:hypothetical protein
MVQIFINLGSELNSQGPVIEPARKRTKNYSKTKTRIKSTIIKLKG